MKLLSLKILQVLIKTNSILTQNKCKQQVNITLEGFVETLIEFNDKCKY